ncbi:MAG TPA: arsenate reductase ArsC [Rudaea sp.]|nr:arsenate reductase ArsC [Rudaea sp.]
MSDLPFNVLFLCTGNSARSIMAESILAKDGTGKFRAFSAGSHPKHTVNPLAIETLQKLGYPIDDLRAKSWDDFDAPDAPPMDFVITVCDNAAGEVCPIWPGHPIRAHWGIEDPSSVEGSRHDKLTAFATAARLLRNRIALFVALPRSRLESESAPQMLQAIGKSEGGSAGVNAADAVA